MQSPVVLTHSLHSDESGMGHHIKVVGTPDFIQIFGQRLNMNLSELPIFGAGGLC
jgi:hypothetical protein